jgi:anti-sigma B factor antagonist
MKVEKSLSSNVTILSVSGRVDSGNAKDFEKAIVPEVGQADGGIIIDGASLEYISSAGLRVILMAAKSAQQSDTNFAVSALNDEIVELFSITGFDSIISIEATIEAALSKFQAL